MADFLLVVLVILVVLLLTTVVVLWVLGSRPNPCLQQTHSEVHTRKMLPSLFHTLKGILFGIRRRENTVSIENDGVLLQVSVADFSFADQELQSFRSLCGGSEHTARLLFPHVLGIQMVTTIATNKYFPVSLVGALHLRSYFEVLQAAEVDSWLRGDNNDASFRCSYLGAVPGSKRGSEFLLSLELFSRKEGTVWWREYVVLFSGKPCPAVHPGAADTLDRLNTQFDFKNIEQVTVTDKLHIHTAETWDFALLSGDINPIHVSALAARLLGQKSRIAHGAMVVGKALSALGDSVQASSLAVSFKGPTPSEAEVCVAVSHSEPAAVDLVCAGSNRPCICMRFG